MGARYQRRGRYGELRETVHMDQPHRVDAAVPNILESEPNIGLFQGKVSVTFTCYILLCLGTYNYKDVVAQ